MIYDPDDYASPNPSAAITLAFSRILIVFRGDFHTGVNNTVRADRVLRCLNNYISRREQAALYRESPFERRSRINAILALACGSLVKQTL